MLQSFGALLLRSAGCSSACSFAPAGRALQHAITNPWLQQGQQQLHEEQLDTASTSGSGGLLLRWQQGQQQQQQTRAMHFSSGTSHGHDSSDDEGAPKET